MSKIITVWGNPGCGKSVFCCVLAKALTKDKEKAIIISADSGTPMLPVWLPEQFIEPSGSVGQALSSLEIDTAQTASRVAVLKSYPFIGLMGYAAGENPLTYPEIKYEKVTALIDAASRLVPYVILDCGPGMTNFFVPAAIEAADVKVGIFTPDLRGVNYFKAHQPLLKDSRFGLDRHLFLAGLARPYHAIDEMGHIIGGFHGILPYSKEVDRCAVSGDMFSAIGKCHPKYFAALRKVVEAVEHEQSK